LRSTTNTPGFTLIELITTIVLIGVLAAASTPRFADLISGADEATFAAIKGAFESAVNVAYGWCSC